jgi:hypothetical protein
MLPFRHPRPDCAPRPPPRLPRTTLVSPWFLPREPVLGGDSGGGRAAGPGGEIGVTASVLSGMRISSTTIPMAASTLTAGRSRWSMAPSAAHRGGGAALALRRAPPQPAPSRPSAGEPGHRGDQRPRRVVPHPRPTHRQRPGATHRPAPGHLAVRPHQRWGPPQRSARLPVPDPDQHDSPHLPDGSRPGTRHPSSADAFSSGRRDRRPPQIPPATRAPPRSCGAHCATTDGDLQDPRKPSSPADKHLQVPFRNLRRGRNRGGAGERPAPQPIAKGPCEAGSRGRPRGS